MSTSRSSVSQLAIAMYGIMQAAIVQATPSFEPKPKNHNKQTQNRSSRIARRYFLNTHEQEMKIEACAIKQARKARNRIKCYENSLFFNPIRNADTQMRIDMLSAELS